MEVRETAITVAVDGEPVKTLKINPMTASVQALHGALLDVFHGDCAVNARSVDIVLHAPLVQVRTLTDLPPVSGRDLLELVELHQSRFFRPFEEDSIVAAEWIGSGDGRAAIAALAPRPLAERLEDAVTDCGLSIVRLLPSAAGTLGPPLLTLRARRRARERRLALTLAGWLLAFSGWLAAGATYALDLHGDDRALSLELLALQEPLEDLAALETRVRSFAPIVDAFRRQGAQDGWALRRLTSVAHALPEDTHIHRFVAERGEGIRLEGHGPDALNVVAQLEQSWSGEVRLQEPPEPDGNADVPRMERFKLMLDEPGP